MDLWEGCDTLLVQASSAWLGMPRRILTMLPRSLILKTTMMMIVIMRLMLNMVTSSSLGGRLEPHPLQVSAHQSFQVSLHLPSRRSHQVVCLQWNRLQALPTYPEILRSCRPLTRSDDHFWLKPPLPWQQLPESQPRCRADRDRDLDLDLQGAAPNQHRSLRMQPPASLALSSSTGTLPLS